MDGSGLDNFEIMYDEGNPYAAMPLFWACYTDIHGCDVSGRGEEVAKPLCDV